MGSNQVNVRPICCFFDEKLHARQISDATTPVLDWRYVQLHSPAGTIAGLFEIFVCAPMMSETEGGLLDISLR